MTITNRFTFAAAAAASASLVAFAAPAFAAPAVALTGDRTLVLFETDTATVSGMVEVSGVDSLLGIDYRPATGQLIGVSTDHRIVEIDAESGETTELSSMETMLPLMEDMQVVVDFNPAADRLRFMTGTTNHRVNVDTGEVIVDGSLAFVTDDSNASADPMVAAAAYINSFGQPDSTAMFNIDAGLSALIQQTAPNDGTLATIGMLGAEIDGMVAFDVQTTEDGMNTAWLVANGALHTVDLETGMVSQSWEFTGLDGLSGDIRDLTILPAM